MSRAIKISTIEQAEDIANRQSNQINYLQSQMNNVEREAKEAARREAEKRVNALRREIENMEDSFNFQIQGLESDMAEMDKAHRQAMKKQSEELSAQSKAQQSELTIQKLQTQLDKCKDDLARLSQSAAPGKSPNPAYKAKIVSEVDAIRNEILPNMRTTFIGNDSKRIEPLREKLRGKLDIISQNADRIE